MFDAGGDRCYTRNRCISPGALALMGGRLGLQCPDRKPSHVIKELGDPIDRRYTEQK